MSAQAAARPPSTRSSNDELDSGASGSSVCQSKNQNVGLRKSSMAWKPQRRTAVENPDEVLYKKFRSILNKLTPERFDSLLAQVKELEINSETRLSRVTDLVVEKALDETHFASLYAQMCNLLLREFSIPSEKNSEKRVNFRQLLLRKCQVEFEKDVEAGKALKGEVQRERRTKLAACESKAERKALQEEFDYADQKLKRRSFGLMRFIGELYNLSILSYAIMHECLLKLLKTPDDEDSVVCVCKLLATVGGKVSAEARDKSLGREAAKTKEKFTMLLNRLKKIISLQRSARKSGGKHLPQRIIFMIEDVCELETRDWIPRAKAQGPKTLDQIQKDAENEKILARAAASDAGTKERGDASKEAILKGRKPPSPKNQREAYALAKEMFDQFALLRVKTPPCFTSPRPRWTTGVTTVELAR